MLYRNITRGAKQQMPHDNCPSCAAPDLAFAAHDHGPCASDALARATGILAAKGLRMTPVRRRTLEILLEGHRAMGAYDVLSRLASEGFGAQPPVAYRALDFLEEHGLAHRIRRLNSFTACMHMGENHTAAFLICRACNAVSEAPAAPARAALESAASAIGFAVESATIEALGLCPACQRASA
jgi:Fur family zinc uptake transcriptional regulator